ncbi:MAG: hypothetical protein ACI9G1_000793 [Pirellulaceae bacterium]|jgi:hypothetical protein
MNDRLLPNSDEQERAKWLWRVLISVGLMALLGGIIGVGAVRIGEHYSVVGFCNATGFFGVQFLKRRLDQMTLSAAFVTVSVVWFSYGTLAGSPLERSPRCFYGASCITRRRVS